jgi:cell surface protein SprA
MKNVYSMGAYQVNPQNFILNIEYTNPVTGVDIPYLPVGGVLETKPLLQVVNLDRLNPNYAASPDGMFDFVDNASTEGGTINAKNGRVFFPVIEPFGSHLEKVLQDNGISQDVINSVVYRELYDSTKIIAQQRPDLNRFWMTGSYQSSSSSDITLNALNIPQGAVTVTAGGQQLAENIDFTVDYTLGRVKILNQGLLESGTPIKISLESNSLFSIQTKTLMGTHFDYRINKDFNLGATVLNLTERPLTQKVNIGDEPISNTMVGFNTDYRTESQFITTMVDRLPFLDTREPSSLTLTGEVAKLFPGTSRAITKEGISYLDDFEGSQSAIDIRSVGQWVLASTPTGIPSRFPEADLDSASLIYGMNRAKMAWYVIDPLFFRDNSITPDHISNDLSIVSNVYQSEIFEIDVFPNRQISSGQPTNIPVVDMAFYPEERGPYNFDVGAFPSYAAGLDAGGRLNDPASRWGGVMKQIQTNDF